MHFRVFPKRSEECFKLLCNNGLKFLLIPYIYERVPPKPGILLPKCYPNFDLGNTQRREFLKLHTYTYMPGKKLTHRLVTGLQPPEKPIEYYDENESGLILRLSKAGSKTFAYRYRFSE